MAGKLFGALRQIVPGKDLPISQPIAGTGVCAAAVFAVLARVIVGAGRKS